MAIDAKFHPIAPIAAAACDAAPLVRMDKSWLREQLRSVLAFRAAHAAPVWIDQWGVHEDAVGGAPTRAAYLAELLELFRSERLHWTYWVWRRVHNPPGWTCDGFPVLCETAQGTYEINELLLHELRQGMASA